VDAVHPVVCRPSVSGETCVELLIGTTRWCVHVTLRPSTKERLTSCAATGTFGTPASYALTGLRALA